MGMDIADAYLEHNLGDGWEDWEGFYEFHKLAIDELDAFNYEEFKKNSFEVKKLGEVKMGNPKFGVLS
jgi:ribose 5-phosphate isomerase B